MALRWSPILAKAEAHEHSLPAEPNELASTCAAGAKEADIYKRHPKVAKAETAGLQELNSFTKAAEQSQPVVKVEQLLSSLRKRFDDVHAEVKRRTEEVARYKEGIRQADSAEHQVTNDRARIHQRADELTQSLSLLNKKVAEAGYTKKVYMHILQRTKFEKDAVRQKNVVLQGRLKSLGLELKEERGALEKQQKKKSRAVFELKQLEQELQGERIIRSQGLKEIDEAIEYKRAAIEKRQVRIMNDTPQDEALLIFEQLLHGFLQGMADVMEIVNKFLNRDLENQKLKLLAEEAEKKLEALDAQSQSWNKTFYDHAERYKMLKRTLGDVDQARRCAASINARLVQLGIEVPWDVNAESSLEHYFQNLCEYSIPKLISLSDTLADSNIYDKGGANEEALYKCAPILQPPMIPTDSQEEATM
ncbi:uncharacterized protein EMH_0001690 [Eimeria mitis]|uniref:Uncharacterized protein n=1 Tax=Eimeria mitis TaxID=44415 RepID=U6KDV4_9EIME|nr:uncharacterized protein EMH_0001690 [Eimeria mitis]CDJ34402.1 hypothetical protein, conserved [Eimeria mitis]